MECKFNSCDIQREPAADEYGAAVRDAIVDTGFGDGTVPEDDVLSYARMVARSLRARGWCAETHSEGSRISKDEVAVWPAGGDPVTKEHVDVCVASGAPQGFCFVGKEIRFLVARGWPVLTDIEDNDDGGTTEEEVEVGALCPGTLEGAKTVQEIWGCGDGNHWVPVPCDRPQVVHPDARAQARQDIEHHWIVSGDRCRAFAPKQGKCYSGADGTADGKVSSRQGFGPQYLIDSVTGIIVTGKPAQVGKRRKDVKQTVPNCVPVW